MIQLTVLHGQPQDPAMFDRYYQETHVPLTKKLPRLKGYTVTKPSPLILQEQPPYYLVVDLYFEDMSALQAALQSPEGQTAVNDVQNFSTGGVTLLVGEVQVCNPVSIGYEAKHKLFKSSEELPMSWGFVKTYFCSASLILDAIFRGV